MDHEEHYKAICHPAFERIEKAQTEHKAQLTELLGLLRGTDKNPGVLHQINTIKDVQQQHAVRIQGHHDVLFGVGKDQSGLVDDMRDQERRQQRASKVLWTALGAFIIQAGVWVRQWMTGGG